MWGRFGESRLPKSSALFAALMSSNATMMHCTVNQSFVGGVLTGIKPSLFGLEFFLFPPKHKAASKSPAQTRPATSTASSAALAVSDTPSFDWLGPTTAEPATRQSKAVDAPRTSTQAANVKPFVFSHALDDDDSRLAGLGTGNRTLQEGQEAYCTFTSPYPGRMLIAILDGTGRRGGVGCGGTLRCYNSKKGNACNKLGESPDMLIAFSLIEAIIMRPELRKNALGQLELFSVHVTIVPVGSVGASAVDIGEGFIDFMRSNERVRDENKGKLRLYMTNFAKACNKQLRLFGKQVTNCPPKEDGILATWDRNTDYQFPGEILGRWGEPGQDHGTLYLLEQALFFESRAKDSDGSSAHLYIPLPLDEKLGHSISLVVNKTREGLIHSMSIWLHRVDKAKFWARTDEEEAATEDHTAYSDDDDSPDDESTSDEESDSDDSAPMDSACSPGGTPFPATDIVREKRGGYTIPLLVAFRLDEDERLQDVWSALTGRYDPQQLPHAKAWECSETRPRLFEPLLDPEKLEWYDQGYQQVDLCLEQIRWKDCKKGISPGKLKAYSGCDSTCSVHRK
ncbi:hypothetical protein LTR56_017812 [Elasticomyces elasticus]|nr:hypothetical protein LTR22_022035 [Elasticomyces elasticus]KAK3629799.1 hypothetical protein LTR56_017812 [Elasticomyces elasticus]KAK4917493.1 hypothetical protein LTR49_014579 [Elasticomyces elasticus]KAK5756383.1 hypothetical protein LTS12_013572 [Elasticomyces elasticus]